MKKISVIILSVFLAGWSPIYAQEEEKEEVPADGTTLNYFRNDLPYTAKANKEFQFLAFFITQGVSSNFYPESSLFNGQLVGRLFGQNSSTTSDTVTAYYVEQRIIPFFIYQPKLFNGKAILRASFEIDWTWGDQAYGLSGNKGSAISADQVNIQTQNIELELIPYKNWAINLGLQRLYDTPFNPYRTYFDKMTTTGYRMAYWGTDAVGVSVRWNRDYSQSKAGFYKLYENNAQDQDDVTLMELVYRKKLSMLWNLGGSVYYLTDRAKGQGGVSVFGQGLNSTLVNYNGGFNFGLPTNEYEADVAWLGAFFSRNPDFWLDRVLVTGFFNYNLGTVDTKENGTWAKKADIGGMAANLRGAYRYGQTVNDLFSLDLIYTTGDGDGIDNGKYSGVITGNTWGMPASIFISSGAYLLFPHANVVNRFTPAIADISNMGYGLTGGTANLYRDLIPHQLNAKIGAAMAYSSVAPQDAGKYMGTELNAALKYSFGPFMSLELHGAYLWLGDFYDSNDTSHGTDINGIYNIDRPVDPWTVFLVYKWLMF
ncbi:MAG TPA: hypothetical protein DCG75_02815 [Bacteroidales bacterium]|jgi:hypothetical protein|nr:hypothetical protein [Bacteroidales bacterium]